ncbi:MAG: hypothetical protein IEMM0002_0964 [bacterium]|nr:MAG: hypothetical protein IEMM0002_0964 [bacterium]
MANKTLSVINGVLGYSQYVIYQITRFRTKPMNMNNNRLLFISLNAANTNSAINTAHKNLRISCKSLSYKLNSIKRATARRITIFGSVTVLVDMH